MSIGAYCDHFHQHVHSRDNVDNTLAYRWGLESLAGAPMAWLANELAEPWLRLIEIPTAKPVDPFMHSGWFSLEISVLDTDALYEGLDKSPFKVIGEPANLELSDNIRAM